MSELKIERYKWQPDFENETCITDKKDSRTFTITLKQSGNVEIECDWDYGYGGRGTEFMEIPLEKLKELINELGV